MARSAPVQFHFVIVMGPVENMITPSVKAQRTFNPIRHIVDNLKPPVNHPKKLLNLALGDPTVHGNLTVPSVVTEAIQEVLTNNTANGYLPSVGMTSARKAIAQYSTVEGFPVSEEDVIIASGASGAIELALSALVNEGDCALLCLYSSLISLTSCSSPRQATMC